MFKLASSSYIWQADIVTNIKKLKDYVKGIQILFFEMTDEQQMTNPIDVDELIRLKNEYCLNYFIHMPLNIDFYSNINDTIRKNKHIIDIGEKIGVDYYVFHIEEMPNNKNHSIIYPDNKFDKKNDNINCIDDLHNKVKLKNCPHNDMSDKENDNINCVYNLHCKVKLKNCSHNDISDKEKYKKICVENIKLFINTCSIQDKFLIENISNNFDFIDYFIDELNIGLCLDIGHLYQHKINLSIIENYKYKIKLVHLHDLDNEGKDHYYLNNLERNKLAISLLKKCNYNGYVILEIFSKEYFFKSLDFLKTIYYKYKM